MQRVNSEEILDTDQCSAPEAETSLRDLCRINRWFGGVGTTRSLIERVSRATGKKHFSVLEVAAGLGEVPRAAGKRLERRGITLEITDLDRMATHLRRGHRAVVADALALPFRDDTYDLVSCSLFTHHLQPDEVTRFAGEATRVCRYAVVINDLIRHPLHLMLVYAGFPLMRSYVSRVDGVASVKRSYTPEEMGQMVSRGVEAQNRVEVSSHYLFRVGVIVWKGKRPAIAHGLAAD